MLLSFILIIILLYTYYYLVELAHCKCFHKDKVDLEYSEILRIIRPIYDNHFFVFDEIQSKHY